MHQTVKIPELSGYEEGVFWSKVNVLGENECWEWTAWKDKDGYGRLGLGNLKPYAHRVAWFLTNGQIPLGKLVLHKCDNPPCANPRHLFTGTNKDNLIDAAKKGRTASGDKNGSRLHPEKLNPARGESHWLSKLTKQDILCIRKRYFEGETQESISEGFGITRAYVSEIVNRKRWTHI